MGENYRKLYLKEVYGYNAKESTIVQYRRPLNALGKYETHDNYQDEFFRYHNSYFAQCYAFQQKFYVLIFKWNSTTIHEYYSICNM